MKMNQAIISVSQLNQQVRNYLEGELGMVAVEGEISNLSKPASGHLYFTLKDNSAQIRCVFFKNRHTGPLASTIADGQLVVANGKPSLYEARGDFQLIIEQISEAGLGLLYQRFEELKNKLSAEGLFLATKKRPLPPMPEAIGVITSPSGAAIRDILSTLERRFPLASVYVYPSEVQGSGAAKQLIRALQQANDEKRCEVIIIARGGGSIEDLWAFNDEQLARCIAGSNIPVVSGVGHQTDFTIADFVADYRAETPTAAATAVTPDSVELLKSLTHSILRINEAIQKRLEQYQLTLHHLTEKTSSPGRAIATYWQKTDFLEQQLISRMIHIIQQKKHQLSLQTQQLNGKNPETHIRQTMILLKQLSNQITQHMQNKLAHLKYHWKTQLSTLHAVSPLATLDRGYAIATCQQKILYSSQQVQPGDAVEIRLAKGHLACHVTDIMD